MSSLTIAKPYDLTLACNEATNQYGLTAEKIHDLESKLNHGNFNPFKTAILDLPTVRETIVPDGIAFRVSYAYRVGIYTLFPADMGKWVNFHVKRNIQLITERECKKLHDAFCRSNLFTSNEPDPLAFMLASPVYRRLHLEGKTSEYLEKCNLNIITSFINKGEVPSPTSFREAALFLKTLNYWSLDLGRPSYLLFCDCFKTVVWGKNENEIWKEMIDSVSELKDKVILEYVKSTFCQRFFMNVCHELECNAEFPLAKEPSIYALPVSAVPHIGRSGSFFEYLTATANAIIISSSLESSLSAEFNANCLKAMTSLGTLVVAIDTETSLMGQIMEACSTIKKIFVKGTRSFNIRVQKSLSVDKFAPFLEKGVCLDLAESDLDLRVSNVSLLKSVRIYWLQFTTITLTNPNVTIDYSGWISQPDRKDNTIQYTFRLKE